MRFKIVSLIAVVGLVAACGTAPTNETATVSGDGMSQGAMGGTQEDLRVNVGDRTFFAFDRYDLSDQARETLQKQAAWLNANSGVSVILEGHCDERGTREYNIALGHRRAAAAADYLMSLGIAKDRMHLVSFGKERPADPASSETAWAKNRRVVMTVKP